MRHSQGWARVLVQFGRQVLEALSSSWVVFDSVGIVGKGERVRLSVGPRGRGLGRWERRMDRWTKTPSTSFYQQWDCTQPACPARFTFLSSHLCPMYQVSVAVRSTERKLYDKDLTRKGLTSVAGHSGSTVRRVVWALVFLLGLRGTFSYLAKRWLPHLEAWVWVPAGERGKEEGQKL